MVKSIKKRTGPEGDIQMNVFSFCDIDFKKPKNHLPSLETPFGTRSIRDSLAYCNRCGLCLQQCPFYVLTQEETLSPRGRNQALLLLIEGKLNLGKNKKQFLRLATTCSLCGRCTQSCPGRIPTPQHLLELRRLLKVRFLPKTLQLLLQWRADFPTLFYGLAQSGLFLRRWGVVKLLRFSGLANLLGCSWLHQIDRMIPPTKKTIRKKWSILKREQEEKPSLIYLPSLETELFLPDVAISAWTLATQKHRPVLWTRTPTGLFEYVYGNVRKARQQLKKLITRHAQLQKGTLPLVTDSMDVYNYLKQAANLFENYPGWKRKAVQFSQQVLFVADLFPQKKINVGAIATPVALDTSALFKTENTPSKNTQKILSTLFLKNFVYCDDRQADLPAFGYGFVSKNNANQLRLLAFRPLVKKEIKTLFVFSGWALMEAFAAGKKHAPQIQAMHIAQLNG